MVLKIHVRKMIFELIMIRFDILLLHEDGEEELLYTSLDYSHPPVLERIQALK